MENSRIPARPDRASGYRPNLLQIVIGLVIGQILALFAFQWFAGSVLG